MIWVSGAFNLILLVLIIYFARKQAVDGKTKLDLEEALRRNAESEKRGAAIDGEVANHRQRLREWLRLKKFQASQRVPK